MRYDVADAYIANTNANHRYVGFVEVPAVQLCDTREGLTVNAPDRNPQSRYGVAAAGRGACKLQILVNDTVSAPTR